MNDQKNMKPSTQLTKGPVRLTRRCHGEHIA